MDAETLQTVRDAATALCLVVGSLMSFAAGLGMLRFPDLLSRMHAGTKPQVLGLLLLLTAVGLQADSPAVLPVLLLAWLFQLLTAPVSAHMVGRAGYRTKHLKRETLIVDDLDEVVARAANGSLPAGAADHVADTER
ncbi:monovalent cation/H(+) antiporter subunit G [Zafaria sp. Z1313]|uniref:monovalent cation/H(+) antiporter subunit G n=1 Tax=unclassified Zafaria TaxID=2828765 RepID=UPI002E75BF2E|nr:monovalent cation/H(+) antiporter subunit G [Zafaria sp. J156]MEE1622334.1 monovalent cation/H(+) antiporter subunit G [Zafaria sp. J156]